MKRTLAAITACMLLAFALAAGGEKYFDKPGDAVGDAGKFSKLAELYSLNYSFHGPQYAEFTLEVAGVFPEELPEAVQPDLVYSLDFGTDSMASCNTTGDWKADCTLNYRPYAQATRTELVGKIDGLNLKVISDIFSKSTIKLNVELGGLRNDWFCRMRVRSHLKSPEGEVQDEMTGIWLYPSVIPRFTNTPAPELPAPDEIVLGDELGAMLTGLFEFALDDQHGALEIRRHGGKYFAKMVWYSGEITQGPLYILKLYEPPKKRKGFTLAAVDIAFKAFYTSGADSTEQIPRTIVLSKFDGKKCAANLEVSHISFVRAELVESKDPVSLEVYRIDNEPEKYPGRQEYIDKLTEESYVSSALEAYKYALSLFNCFASEDWGPGYELGRLGGYENKRYIAKRAIKMASLVDHFPDSNTVLHERALQLRWRIHTDANSILVLRNQDVTQAIRMPILTYIFRHTDANLDWMKMKTDFSDDEVKKIKRGLTMGAEQIFRETFGYFTPFFDYYADIKGAEELPAIDKIGKNLAFSSKDKNGEKFYDLLLERMMQYTIYTNSYESNSDYLPSEKYTEMGLKYPAIFMFGKVDTKAFKNAISTRAQSEPELNNAKLSTGLAYTRGIERGKPAFCHIVLDEGFTSDEVKDILLWAIIFICMDNLKNVKLQLPMQFLKDGVEMLPDPYKDIEKFGCKLGGEAWWNAFLNVYMTYGMKKLITYGRSPYYLKTAVQHPQVLADLFKLERYGTWQRDFEKFRRR